MKLITVLRKTADGHLAGTITLLDSGWHSLITYSHMDATKAAACVTYNPAIAMGLEDRGILQTTKNVPISHFSKRGTNRPVMTVCKGKNSL